MHGRRLPDGTDWSSEAQPGDYAKLNEDYWWAISPDGDVGSFRSPQWHITEHPDRTVSVVPSIWFDSPKGWHGFLQHGIWVQA